MSELSYMVLRVSKIIRDSDAIVDWGNWGRFEGILEWGWNEVGGKLGEEKRIWDKFGRWLEFWRE